MNDLERKLLSGDTRALSQLITLAENKREEVWRILAKHYCSTKPSRVVGITGPPGAGKSSLVGCLIDTVKQSKERVGILAVDPMSPFSGGALLGDRVRLSRHFTDPSIYIRSLSSRGQLGGLSLITREALQLMKISGFNWIFLETVGVGQSEIDVTFLADVTLVILVPESGDEIQTLKAGVLEIADILVVHKSDRPGATELLAAVNALVSLTNCQTKVLGTSLQDRESILTLSRSIVEMASTTVSNTKVQQRMKHEKKELARIYATKKIGEWIDSLPDDGKNPYEFVLSFSQSWKPVGTS